MSLYFASTVGVKFISRDEQKSYQLSAIRLKVSKLERVEGKATRVLSSLFSPKI